MPRLRPLGKRAGPLGLVLTLVDVWSRLTPKQRKQLAAQIRRHGPRVAAKALETLRARRRVR